MEFQKSIDTLSLAGCKFLDFSLISDFFFTLIPSEVKF